MGVYQHVMLQRCSLVLSGKSKTGGSKDKPPLQNSCLLPLSFKHSLRDFKAQSVPPFLARIVSSLLFLLVWRGLRMFKRKNSRIKSADGDKSQA